jgi:AAA+ superfamily predicted ATPase
MKKVFFLILITLSGVINIHASEQDNQTFTPVVRVQPDFSNVQVNPETVAEIAKIGISSMLQGGAEGLAGATKNGSFGKNIEEGLTNIGKDATGAMAGALSDDNIRNNVRDSGQAMGNLMGSLIEGMGADFETKLFPEIQKMSLGAIGSIFNTRNALQWAGPTALGTVVVITARYAPTIFWEVIKQRLLNPKPVILLPGSKYGRVDRFKRWKSGYKTPPMIFDGSIKERLEEIEEKTKNIRDHIYNGEKITYDNLLLYGKPGTGKTLFAQILADKTDMDFLPVTAASLLQAGVEGIKYFDELITMANKSKYGVIIFVDEADALFVDRDKLSPDSDHYKVLNHILAVTGSGSNKFMLIAATNHAYVMDPAMGRRFQDRVLMPLPDQNTRKELLNIYINQQLLDAKVKKPAFISAARSILTNKKIDAIAQNTAGLSHAEIKDMVTIMGKKANATKNGIITQRNVDSAVAQAIEKMHALEQDRLELEKKNAAIHPQLSSPIISEEIIIAAAATQK